MDPSSSHNGISFTQAELEAFQRVFPTTKAAALMGRIIDTIADSWRLRLTSLSSSSDIVRQSQGALDALGSVIEEGIQLAALAIDWTASEETEDPMDEGDQSFMEEGIDVRY